MFRIRRITVRWSCFLMNECDALYIDALAEYRPNHDVATYVLPPAERVNIFKKYKFEMLAKYYTVIII